MNAGQGTARCRTAVSGHRVPRRAGLLGLLALLIGAWGMATPGLAGATPPMSGPWTIGGGPPGPTGALLALAGAGGAPATLIAAGQSRSAVSTDGGASWQSAYDKPGLSGQASALLSVGSGPRPVILAGTTDGLYRAIDRGLHWQRVGVGLPTGTGVQALTLLSDTIMAGLGGQDASGAFSDGGLYASRDSGATWTAVALPKGAGRFVSALTVARGVLVVATVSGPAATPTGHLYARAPGGAFHLVEAGLPTTYRVHALLGGADWLVAGTGNGFYSSSDGGTHWTHAAQGHTGPFVLTLAADPRQPRTVYGGSLQGGDGHPGAGVWQSSDGGRSWRGASPGLPTYMDVHSILPLAGPTGATTLYAATDGVWRSDGGRVWKEASSGLNFGQVRVLAADPTHPGVLFAGATYSGFYRSGDGGRTWRVANQGLLNNQPLGLGFGGSGALYAGTESFVERWAGDHWQSLSAALDKTRTLSAFALGVSPTGADTLYVAGLFGKNQLPALLRSRDRGRSWQKVSPPALTTLGDPTAAAIRYLAVGVSGSTLLYAATATTLYLSGDSGQSWTAAGPITKGSTAVTALASDAINSQTAYLATVSVNTSARTSSDAFAGATVWRTLDGGAHWTALRAYGPSTIVLHIGAAEAGLLLAGAHLSGQHIDALLDQSTATGGWRGLTAGLPGDVFPYTTAADGQRLYVGTGGHGVWSRTLSSPGGAPAATPGRGSGPTPTPVLPGA